MKGFTLLEAMMGFILIATGLVGSVRIQDAYIRQSVHARQLAEAALFCQQRMESLRAYGTRSGFDGLASSNDTVTGINAVYSRTWTVSTNAYGTKVISVTASWAGISNQAESFTLSSEMSYEDPASSARLDLY